MGHHHIKSKQTYGEWWQWQLKRVPKWIIIIMVILVCGLLKKLWDFNSSTNNSNMNYFATAKGQIHIDEIIENVFNKNGYSFIKNDLIPILKKDVPMTCDEVFSEWQKIADNGLTLDPPKELPNAESFLLNYYTQLESWYINSIPHNDDQTLSNWNETFMNHMINIAKENPYNLPRSYRNQSMAVYMATKYFNVNNQIGAVIGSLTPWAESFILANGAKNVTTIDYQKVKVTHPQMNFLYAPELPTLQKSLNNHFDFIVTYSSIEHSGLGRYGDPMDPIGDIREMNKIHCLLKTNGLLFVGFPVGKDTIYYNAHRIYGRMRLAMMFEGYRLLGTFWLDSTTPIKLTQRIVEKIGGINQYLFVLQKID